MLGTYLTSVMNTTHKLTYEHPTWAFSVASWWRHQMETFSALLAICAGNSPVPGEFPTQRPVTRSFDVFFDLRLDGRLSKHSWGWWLETPSCPLWRHSNDSLIWFVHGSHIVCTRKHFEGSCGRMAGVIFCNRWTEKITSGLLNGRKSGLLNCNSTTIIQV